MTTQTRFIEDFDSLTKTAQKQTPDWFKELRARHAGFITSKGFPTTKDEEWKYTNVASVLDKSYTSLDLKEQADLSSLSHYINPDDVNVVFVNGRLNRQYSTIDGLDSNLNLSVLDQPSDFDEQLKKLLLKFENYPSSAFTSLNNALFKQCLYIDVKNKLVSKDLIHIIHITTSSGKAGLNTPRVLIRLSESCEITVLESNLSVDPSACYLSAPLTDIDLQENAVLHYCKAQDESTSAYHIGQTRVWIENNANFDGFSFMTGSKIARNDLDIVISGEGANANLNALYSITGTQHVDNHTSVDHREPNCTSNQLYKGILNGSARAVFNGKIFVKPIAQQTNSYQLNKNLLLGDNCRVDTKPQLEIFADDVKCTHGATIGQLEEEELFYLQTRNISRAKAVDMLSRGFADDALNSIQDTGIRDKLHILLEPSFKH